MIYKYKKFLESQNLDNIVDIVAELGYTVSTADIIPIQDGYIIELNSKKVIRLSKLSLSFYDKLINKNINGVVKTYTIGKVGNYNYYILENLEQLSTINLTLFNNVVNDVLKFGKNKLNNTGSFESQIINLSNNIDYINAIKKDFLTNDKEDELKLLLMFIDVYKTLNLVDITFHENSLMQDYDGNIKIVDISKH